MKRSSYDLFVDDTPVPKRSVAESSDVESLNVTPTQLSFKSLLSIAPFTGEVSYFTAISQSVHLFEKKPWGSELNSEHVVQLEGGAGPQPPTSALSVASHHEPTSINSDVIADNADKSVETIRSALALEEAYTKKNSNSQVLILRFPDPEINRSAISEYSDMIETVHVPQTIAPRYCLLHLKDDADVEQTMKQISKIRFGSGYLKAEFGCAADSAPTTFTDGLEPHTLHIENLPHDVTISKVNNHFPGAQSVDIGFGKDMKQTCCAFIRYPSIEAAMEAYKAVVNTTFEQRSLVVRFRRLNSSLHQMSSANTHCLPADSPLKQKLTHLSSFISEKTATSTEECTNPEDTPSTSEDESRSDLLGKQMKWRKRTEHKLRRQIDKKNKSYVASIRKKLSSLETLVRRLEDQDTEYLMNATIKIEEDDSTEIHESSINNLLRAPCVKIKVEKPDEGVNNKESAIVKKEHISSQCLLGDHERKNTVKSELMKNSSICKKKFYLKKKRTSSPKCEFKKKAETKWSKISKAVAKRAYVKQERAVQTEDKKSIKGSRGLNNGVLVKTLYAQVRFSKDAPNAKSSETASTFDLKESKV